MDALEFIRVRELDVAVRIWNPKATRTLIAWHGLARHGGDFAALARAGQRVAHHRPRHSGSRTLQLVAVSRP
ncbi:hypothetical protein HAALTHF_48210n [Vreelandella aquamarina]|nr:hypothetical protein HAALTHF_48210n [Halomonas axialensis]